ncbi:MAG: alanine racemase [Beijerinckiaceae bacterium]
MTAPDPFPPAHLAQAILTIDLDAIVANWHALAARVGPAECSAVVKADAYGTGLARVAPALARAGCKTFFVAHVSEAIALRAILPDRAIRIFTLNGITGNARTVAAMLEAGVRPIAGSFEELQLWRDAGGAAATSSGFGLQFSTGMNRLGFAPKQAGEVAAWLAANPALAADFLMSHFVSSEESGNPLNQAQISSFEAIRAQFPGLAASLANSSGIFLPAAPHFDLVRPGYALYGGNPCPGSENPMRPAVRLEAPILQVRQVEAGETCGYNATWTAARPSRLATIGIGYADGLLRSAAAAPGKPGAGAIAGGTRCPFAGRVSMDLIILDVTEAPEKGVRPGTFVELLGADIGVDELASHAGTIGYEILTSFGHRYHRIYTGG